MLLFWERYDLRHVIRAALFTTLVSGVMLFGVGRAYMAYSDARAQDLPAVAQPAPNSQSSAHQSAGAAPAAHKPSPAPLHSRVIIPPVPRCTPDSGFSAPASMNLANTTPGLHTEVLASHHYHIYGYNGSQIQQQIAACAPKLSEGNDFTGYTVYRLNWQYDYTISGGTCTISDVRVGLRVQEVLPFWTASPYAVSGLDGQWQHFANALNTHEYGHVQLDKQYAAKLTTDLAQIPATGCTSFPDAIQVVVNKDVSALNSANASYDARTDHGATQGAIVP